jgi:uncharacterized radical SAM superfamily Fe-S cluster-containing enzyme
MIELLNKKTRSLCNACYEEIPAIVYEENGQVFMKKTCPKHGDFKALVEKDADFYKWFIKLEPQEHSTFRTLLVPVTFKCNMNCAYCFSWAPERKDLSADEILARVGDFPGHLITLTGGEPTVREDLPRLITSIRRLGKSVSLATNGLKLADAKYLRSLAEAGLNAVVFSFDGLKNEIYHNVKRGGSDDLDVVGLKKEALANLKNERILTSLSSTIYPGMNDREINDLLILALNNSTFIEQLRIRNCAKIGRNRSSNVDGPTLSEMLELFSKQTGLDKRTLVKHFLHGRMGRSVIFDIEGFLEGGAFKLLGTGRIIREVDNALSKLHVKPPLKKMQVKLVHWPTVENIDLEELKTPLGYLDHKGENITKAFQGVILEEQDI